MARGGDEDLRAKVLSYELVFAHPHVGEARAVELIVDAVDVIWTGGKQSENYFIAQSGLTSHHPFAPKIRSSGLSGTVERRAQGAGRERM